MSAIDLITDLARLGIRLEAQGDRLRFHPRSAVTPGLAKRMKAHKDELLAMLRRDTESPAIELTDASAGQAEVNEIESNTTYSTDVGDNTRENVRCRCESTTFVDVPIHEGRSVRRDCAKCDRFIDFVKWYED